MKKVADCMAVGKTRMFASLLGEWKIEWRQNAGQTVGM